MPAATALIKNFRARARDRNRFSPLLSVITALLVFLVYFSTAAPGAWWGDGQELACAARTLGIPHPTGYPLYMLTGHAAMRVMGWLDPGRALTMFSALLLAISVGVLIMMFQRVNTECGMRNAECGIELISIPHSAFRIPHFLPVLGAALLIAFARTVWEHATFAEVYPLTFFIGALLLLVAWTPAQARPGTGRAAALGLLLGLGLLNHYSILALAPLVFFCVIRWSLHAGKSGWLLPVAAASCCALGLLGYLYLPLRAATNPPLNWGDPSTAERFWWVLSGGQFKTTQVQVSAAAVHYGLENWLAWWSAQWAGVAWERIALRDLAPATMTLLAVGGALLVIAAAAGLVRLARRRWDLGLGLLCALAATAVFAALYRIPDIHGYFMIALPPAMIGWIVLIRAIPFFEFHQPQTADGIPPEGRTPNNYSAFIRAVPVLLALAVLLNQYHAIDKSWDDGPALYGATVLDALPQDALVVTVQGGTGDAEIYSLWYQQMVLGKRPDVTVYGSGFMFQGWYARYFERPERPRIPVFVEEHPISSETDYFVKLFRGVLLPNLAQGRRVMVTYKHPLFTEYLSPRPAAGLISPAYAEACAFRYLPNPVLYELHPNPQLASLDEKALTAEFEAFARRRAGGGSSLIPGL